MDCIIIRPPFEHTGFDQDCQESLGIGYLLASLRKNGFAAGVLDGELQELTPSEIAEILSLLKPAVIGFSLVSEYGLDSACETARIIKSDSSFLPHVTAGGYLPSFFPQKILDIIPELDSVIQFEGEKVLPELVSNTIKGSPFDTPGLFIRGAGMSKLTEISGRIHSLDDLPFPHRDMLPVILEKGYPATVSGSRGCSGGCSFCSITKFNHNSCGIPLRMRSADNIFKEIDYLHRIYSADVFHFIDDDFIGNRDKGFERADRLADLIKKADFDILFSFECRPDHVDGNLFGNLKKSGLAGVFIGIDSAVERTRDLYNKKCSMETVEQSVRIIKDLGIDVDTGFIPFHPGVTFNELMEEYDFLFRHNLDNLHTLLNRLYCTGESVLSKRLYKKGILRSEGDFELSYDFSDEKVALFHETASISLKPLFPLWYDIYKKRQRQRDLFMLGKDSDDSFRNSDEILIQTNTSVRNAVLKIIDYVKTSSDNDLLFFTRTIRKDLRKEIMRIQQ